MGNGELWNDVKGKVTPLNTGFTATLRNQCGGLMTEAENQLFFSTLVYFVTASGLVCP